MRRGQVPPPDPLVALVDAAGKGKAGSNQLIVQCQASTRIHVLSASPKACETCRQQHAAGVRQVT